MQCNRGTMKVQSRVGTAVDGTMQNCGSVLLWMERCKTVVQSCCGWNDAKLRFNLAVDETMQNYGSILLWMKRCKTMVQSCCG
jgi:hypothetical protein